MAGFSLFQDAMSSVMSHAARLPSLRFRQDDSNLSLTEHAERVLSARGEASALLHAERMLKAYHQSAMTERIAFFHALLDKYCVDAEQVAAAAQQYAGEQSGTNYSELFNSLKSRRVRLFRRLNATRNGIVYLVEMRADLLKAIRAEPKLKPVDIDLNQLFRHWFNRGFLVMRPIDWTTPAHILEKIIAYEAVHEIGSWDELRMRLAPTDRRCFAFFHLSMEDEPLIFVEVALTDHIPAAIDKVLSPDRVEALAAEEATAAIFYSISNCQAGLAGISFGNFLIKQVAGDLKQALPNLKDFVTLSPVPGFMRWLEQAEFADGSAGQKVTDILQVDPMLAQEENRATLEKDLPTLAAQYLVNEKNPAGLPRDPVTRFHLGNGARLERINYLGDTSKRGLQQAAGLMVNYYYDLDKVEQYHEAFAEQKQVTAAKGVLKLL
ncbi:MAG: malonyl-CoA decarboxylase domain-containing protein [Thiolinea sp.]